MRLVLCPTALIVALPIFTNEPAPLVRFEVHCDAVDAIAKMRRRRPIVEDMPEGTAAPAAMHLGANHTETLVCGRLDRPLDGVVEARPAGAALELLFRHEQRLAAVGARVCAVPLADIL